MTTAWRQAALSLLMVFTLLAGASAQAVDSHPLRPVDNSNPRDALKTFLDTVKTAVQAAQHRNEQALHQARARARRTA